MAQAPPYTKTPAYPQTEPIQYDLEDAYRQGLDNEMVAALLSADAGFNYETLRKELSDEQIIDDLIVTRQPTDLTPGFESPATDAVLEGTARGVTRSGPAIAAGFAGAKAVTPVAAFAGPWAPLVIFGGGVISGLGTYLLASDKLENALFSEVPVNPEYRHLVEGGVTFGENLPMLAAPYLWAAKSSVIPQQLRYLNPLRKFWGNISRSAKEHPFAMNFAELSASASSGLAAAIAEKQNPANETTRFAYEMAGAIFNPPNLLLTQGPTALQQGKRVLERFSAQGRERAAARLFVSAIEELGEDPKALMQLLGSDSQMQKWLTDYAKREGVALDLSPAELTGSRAFALIEQSLAKNSGKYGNQVQEGVEQNMRGARRLINLMTQTGDPGLIQLAAKAKEKYIEGLVNGRLALAMDRADANISRVLNNDPENVELAGRKVHAIVEEGLRDVIKESNRLWEAVDKNVVAEASNIENVWRQHQVEFAEEMKNPKEGGYPGIIKQFVRDTFNVKDAAKEVAEEGSVLQAAIAKGDKVAYDTELARIKAEEAAPEPEKITLGSLHRFKKQMNNKARSLNAQQNYAEANYYEDMASAAQNDLDAIALGDDVSEETVAAFNQARAFTRALHDSFTRSFGGQVLRKASSGELRIDPDLLYQKLNAGSSSVTAKRMQQLRKALSLTAREEGLSGEQIARIDTLEEAENTILRELVRPLVDATTGRLNVRSFNTWKEKNRRLLKQFPDLNKDFESVEMTEALLTDLATKQNLNSEALKKGAVFKQFIGGNNINPLRRLDSVLAEGRGAGDDPIRGLKQLAKMSRDPKVIKSLTKRFGEDAGELLRKGFRDTILERGFVYSGGTGEGLLNFNAYHDWLYKPMEGSQISRMKVLRDSGVVDEGFAGRYQHLLNQARKIQNAQIKGVDITELLADAPQAMVDLVERLAGSAFGSAAGQKVPGRGQGLIEATAGIRVVKNLFSKVPATQLRKIMREAASDPKIMANLLKMGLKANRRSFIQWQSRLQSGLMGAGIRFVAPADDKTPDDFPEEPQASPAFPQQEAPVTPVPPPQTRAPAPAMPPRTEPQGRPAGPSNIPFPERQSYAAMFPNDPISDVIRQQQAQGGIGSLMPG
jgi:hypothetical protein